MSNSHTPDADLAPGLIQTTYNGRDYIVPETGRNENGEIFNAIPDEHGEMQLRDYAMAFLMQDGNLDVPGGRYGRDTATCAEVAIVLSLIMQTHNGEAITYYMLNSDMGLVVNGADGVADVIGEYAETIGLDPADYLSGSDLGPDEFTLEIEMGNDAMRSPGDVARALREAADEIENLVNHRNVYGESGTFRDDNGNTIGRWEFE